MAKIETRAVECTRTVTEDRVFLELTVDEVRMIRQVFGHLAPAESSGPLGSAFTSVRNALNRAGFHFDYAVPQLLRHIGGGSLRFMDDL